MLQVVYKIVWWSCQEIMTMPLAKAQDDVKMIV